MKKFIAWACIWFFSSINFSSAEIHNSKENIHSQLTDNFYYQLSSLDNPTKINSFQQWQLKIEDMAGKSVNDAEIVISGGMPDHNHGLPTAPKITNPLGDGKYLIGGVKFHMSGRWRLEFDVTAKGISDTVIFEIQL